MKIAWLAGAGAGTGQMTSRLAALSVLLNLVGTLSAADPGDDNKATLDGDHITTAGGDLVIHPINHATFAMSWKGKVIYVDPVGGAQRFTGLPRPDLIL